MSKSKWDQMHQSCRYEITNKCVIMRFFISQHTIDHLYNSFPYLYQKVWADHSYEARGDSGSLLVSSTGQIVSCTGGEVDPASGRDLGSSHRTYTTTTIPAQTIQRKYFLYVCDLRWLFVFSNNCFFI